MFRAPLRLLGLFASLALVTLTAAGTLVVASARASDPVDPIITGSIVQGAATAPVAQGSAAFRKALAVLVGGDQAGAYQLAAALPDPLERRTIQWAAIYYGNGAIDYGSVEHFAEDAPDFASDALYKTRLEQSLVNSSPSTAEIIQYLGGGTPGSVKGQVLLAGAYAQQGQRDKATRLARALWVDNFLDPDDEKLVLGALGGLLSPSDHWARTVHLLMNDRTSSTQRMLPRLSAAQKTLAIAGIAVVSRAGNAGALLAKVDPTLRGTPLYFFMAAQDARLNDRLSAAFNALAAARGPLPDAPEWWYERRTLIRLMLAEGDAKLAYRAAATYTNGPEGRLVEARFHAGWIALAFLNNARDAKPQFEKMLTLATLPDSVTQAEYWLGRTLLVLGDKAGAHAAFTKAAQFSTMYYGMLSRDALGLKGVEMRGLPSWQGSQAGFEARDIVRAVRLLAANGQQQLAVPLLRNFSNGLKDGGELLLAARLAQAIDAHYLAIAIADVADQRGSPLDPFSYPMDPLPANMKLADIDKAAIYAIARQESKFRIDAISVAGARGLMQLMPGTARETAARMGISYSPSRLTTDGSYNALIGSTYLAGQLHQFDGSLALAAAGYNAGAGNAAKWVAAYGDPRLSTVDPVVWIELIPFEETRRYVQRVLSNYVVYRARLGAGEITMDQALRRIPD
jgi:soluble lytic murein transglycosylase